MAREHHRSYHATCHSHVARSQKGESFLPIEGMNETQMCHVAAFVWHCLTWKKCAQENLLALKALQNEFVAS
jgi:hypothetical protein